MSKLLLVSFLFACFASAIYPDPVPSSGNLTYVHDPNIVYKDGTYYRFCTFGGIHIASAPDMTGPWKDLGEALDGGSIIDLDGNTSLWAPDVSLVNGIYYMYYAVSTSGSQNSEIGVATSTDLVPGSWTDYGSIGIPKNSVYNKIDPNLFITDDGQPLMTFGSYWRDIFQVPMASPPLKMQADVVPVNIEYNSTRRAAAAGSTGPPEVMEGSFQFKYKDSSEKVWYYLFWSSGECCNQKSKLSKPGDEYKVMVARSDLPTGPWVDDMGFKATQNGGRLVLGSHGNHVYAPGGQGVMYDPKSQSPLIYYHYVDPSVGYGVYDFRFGFNYLDFSSGWPVVVDKPASNATATSAPPQGSLVAKPNAASSAKLDMGLAVSLLAAVCSLLML